MARTWAVGAVEIPDLNKMRRDLSRAAGSGPGKGAIAAAFKRTNRWAAEQVIAGAKQRASTKTERKAARSLKAANQQRYAIVRLGGARYPFAEGAEFGAKQDKRRSAVRGGTAYTLAGWNQFRPWRGSGSDAGYFLWPEIRATAPERAARYLEVLENELAGSRF